MKIYQTTPASYIQDRRIAKVAHLLRVSDDPVSAIGYDCGFSIPAHLTKYRNHSHVINFLVCMEMAKAH